MPRLTLGFIVGCLLTLLAAAQGQSSGADGITLGWNLTAAGQVDTLYLSLGGGRYHRLELANNAGSGFARTPTGGTMQRGKRDKPDPATRPGSRPTSRPSAE